MAATSYTQATDLYIVFNHRHCLFSDNDDGGMAGTKWVSHFILRPKRHRSELQRP